MNSDERLARDAFEQTHVPPSPALIARTRDRLRAERRHGMSPRVLRGLTVLGGGLAVLIVADLLVASGALDLAFAPAPASAPGPATLAHRPASAPGSSALSTSATAVVPALAQPRTAPYQRVDWDGRAVGWFIPPADAPRFTVSGDGALIALAAPDGGSDIVDAATGQGAGHVTAAGLWSSDGAHVMCRLGADGRSIQVTDLDHPGGPLTESIGVTGHNAPGAGWDSLGCSATGGVLVAARFEEEAHQPYAPAELDVIDLNTGAVRLHVSYAGQPLVVAPVLSPGGVYLAENDPSGRSAAIRDLATGDVVGHVAGTVVAFSGDDRLVLTNRDQRTAALADWRSGRRAWVADGVATPLAVRPGGRDLILALSGHPLLVRGDRQVIDLAPNPNSVAG